MKDFLKNRWGLVAVLCAFAAFKLQHLAYPYYWDESWPYASAVTAMHNGGLSLLPGAIDSNLSRGHPMLFHVLAAGWMKLFGPSHVAMHSFALVIGLLFLVVIFEALLRMAGVRAAVMGLLLVALQEVFIVQSSSLLPEVMLAFLCFASLWAWVSGRYLLAGLFLALAFFTKESALIMGFVLGLDALVSLFSKTMHARQKVARLLAVCVPCQLILAFFMAQRQVLGWFVMPVHSGAIKLNWAVFFSRVRTRPVEVMFGGGIRGLLFLLPVFIVTWLAVRHRQARHYILPALAVYIYCLLHEDVFRMAPPLLFVLLFALLWIAVCWQVAYGGLIANSSQRRFVFLAGSFIFCMLCFSSATDFFAYRYLLVATVFLLVVAALVLNAAIPAVSPGLYYPILFVQAGICIAGICTNTGFLDADLGSYNAMEVEQKVVDYLEGNNLHEKHIAAGGYLDRMHLTDPATGFLHGSRVFSNVKWEVDETTDVVLFNNIEPDYRYVSRGEWHGFRLAYRYTKDGVWAEVYRRD